MGSIKRFVARVPVVGPSAKTLYRALAPRRDESFRGSASYWDMRYRSGGNSGAGSRFRLAEFKAEILNRFVREHAIASVIEFGCGDGAQLQLADYPAYTGLDVSPAAVARCRTLFERDRTKSFHTVAQLPPGKRADLSLSLDVIYHLVEDGVFRRYMLDLFDASRGYVVIYASNEDRPWPQQHVRHRRFTDWIAANRPQWDLVEHVPNRYPYDPENPDHTSFSDFFIFRRPGGPERDSPQHLC